MKPNIIIHALNAVPEDARMDQQPRCTLRLATRPAGTGRFRWIRWRTPKAPPNRYQPRSRGHPYYPALHHAHSALAHVAGRSGSPSSRGSSRPPGHETQVQLQRTDHSRSRNRARMMAVVICRGKVAGKHQHSESAGRIAEHRERCAWDRSPSIVEDPPTDGTLAPIAIRGGSESCDCEYERHGFRGPRTRIEGD